jgi:hypothetical protein
VAEALTCIEKSRSFLNLAHGRYQLYLRKWEEICDFRIHEEKEKLAARLTALRQESYRNQEWELLRECDLHEALLLKKSDLLTHVLVGSPYLHYRNKILKKVSSWYRVAGTYDRSPAHFEKSLHLSTGADDQGRIILKPGQKLHRLISFLAADFYKPAPIPEIFNQVFPEERFNIETSPHRLRELTRRLRNQGEKSGYRFRLDAREGCYVLNLQEGNCRMIYDLAPAPSADFSESLAQIFGNNYFSSKDVSAKLKIPHTTVYRNLKVLVEKGEICRAGTGNQTKYFIPGKKTPNQNRAA